MSSVSQLLTQKVVGSESSTPPQSLTLQQNFLLKRQPNFINPSEIPTRLLDTPVFFQKTAGTVPLNYQGSECQDNNYLDLLSGEYANLFGECRISKFSFKVSNFDGNKPLLFKLVVNGKEVYPTNGSGIITGTYRIFSGTRLGEFGLLYITPVGFGSFSTLIGSQTPGIVNDIEVVVNLDSMVKLIHDP